MIKGMLITLGVMVMLGLIILGILIALPKDETMYECTEELCLKYNTDNNESCVSTGIETKGFFGPKTEAFRCDGKKVFKECIRTITTTYKHLGPVDGATCEVFVLNETIPEVINETIEVDPRLSGREEFSR